MKFLIVAYFIFFSSPLHAQVGADTSLKGKSAPDTIIAPLISVNAYKTFSDSNFLLNVKGKPVAMGVSIKQPEKQEIFFYLIAGILIFLGVLKTFYNRYFITLFRVFFNTSLRQNQLTDQLEQAKLPSLLFNIFFIATAGLYIYFMRRHFSADSQSREFYLIGLCTAAVALCYFGKFLFLRFTGWATDFNPEAEKYIFIIFLLNKIEGIFLLPFIIILAFGTPSVASYAAYTSLIILGFIFLLRFYRAYSLLQQKLQVSRVHFFIYTVAFEILPLMLIYKAVLRFSV